MPFLSFVRIILRSATPRSHLFAWFFTRLRLVQNCLAVLLAIGGICVCAMSRCEKSRVWRAANSRELSKSSHSHLALWKSHCLLCHANCRQHIDGTSIAIWVSVWKLSFSTYLFVQSCEIIDWWCLFLFSIDSNCLNSISKYKWILQLRSWLYTTSLRMPALNQAANGELSLFFGHVWQVQELSTTYWHFNSTKTV